MLPVFAFLGGGGKRCGTLTLQSGGSPGSPWGRPGPRSGRVASERASVSPTADSRPGGCWCHGSCFPLDLSRPVWRLSPAKLLGVSVAPSPCSEAARSAAGGGRPKPPGTAHPSEEGDGGPAGGRSSEAPDSLGPARRSLPSLPRRPARSRFHTRSRARARVCTDVRTHTHLGAGSHTAARTLTPTPTHTGFHGVRTHTHTLTHSRPHPHTTLVGTYTHTLARRTGLL